MTDLIDRAALLADINESVVFSGKSDRTAEQRGAWKIIDRIESAPAVDAVEVVRCKACRKRDTEECTMEYKYEEYPWKATKDNDFCSSGERRTDATD